MIREVSHVWSYRRINTVVGEKGKRSRNQSSQYTEYDTYTGNGVKIDSANQ